MSERWTEQQIRVLKKLFNQGSTDKEIAQKLNSRFGTSRTWKAVESKRRYIDLQNKPRKKWTPEDDDKLKKAVQQDLSTKEISKNILTNRTADAVRMRKYKLGLAEKRDHSVKEWSTKEETILHQMIKEGEYKEEIAERLGRTVSSVYGKIKSLGLTRNKVNKWSPQETRRLKSLVDKKYTDKEIAGIMDRTPGSIRGKRRAENIPKQVDDLK